ncbi:hypothetical protein [Acetobacterium bakii]|uniref:HTH cro/C1-type domain-containing protein n=1 Tax=Acetobacterium bakii TaxID=52689 RepID=A0A0L6TZA0_9FIRM|nr:hypothetical protein [Acetobacterium bakii]KNZ41392.1 hypothetical protein AKG39_12290 [Acetobacterium bakii]
MKNKEVRKFIKNSGFYQWQIAEAIGIHEVAFSRKMRHELKEMEKFQIFEAIEKLSKEKNK